MALSTSRSSLGRGWFALAALLYAPGASPAPPPPAPPAAATAQSPDADFAPRMPELMSVVEEYRGLRFAHPVPLHTLSAAELGEKLAAGGKTGPGSILGDVRPLEIVLKAFGLIPQWMDLQVHPQRRGDRAATTPLRARHPRHDRRRRSPRGPLV